MVRNHRYTLLNSEVVEVSHERHLSGVWTASDVSLLAVRQSSHVQMISPICISIGIDVDTLGGERHLLRSSPHL